MHSLIIVTQPLKNQVLAPCNVKNKNFSPIEILLEASSKVHGEQYQSCPKC